MGGWGVFRTLVDGFEWVLWRWEEASVHSPFVCPSPTPVLFPGSFSFFFLDVTVLSFHMYIVSCHHHNRIQNSPSHTKLPVFLICNHTLISGNHGFIPHHHHFFPQNILALFPVSGGKHSLSIYFRAYLMVKDSLSFPSLRIFLFHLHSWKNVFTR